MPASSQTTPFSGNAVLDAIDTGARWSGEITYNRIDAFDGTETAHFTSILPSPYQTSGQGLTGPMWELVAKTLAVFQTYAAFSYGFANSLEANYQVGDFYKPDNANVAGIAGEPGKAPVLALNRLSWDGFYGQLQPWIVLHEVGHTLGLHHVSAMPAGLDYSQYTVMSYNWFQYANQDQALGLPLTPMALDVAVLQAKYGAATTNTGATTYRLSNLVQDLDGADGSVQNGGGYVCIWDSGGEDTIVYGGTSGAMLNLNAATLQYGAYAGDLADVIGDVAATSRIFANFAGETQDDVTEAPRAAGGFFSSLLDGERRAPGGYTIANGAKIEAAEGGGGDDLIIGNELANRLLGNGGRDDLFGGSGGDSLDGGAGDDMVFGGLGGDSLADSGGGSNYLRGDEGDDSVMGGAGFDDINGNMGADTAAGGGGEDWVVGGKDNDVLFGGDAYDLVYGNLGADTISGDGGDDIVRGGQQDDVLFGGAGADYLSGDRDNDTVSGGAGADVFHTFGAAGLDRVLDFNAGEGDRVQLDPGTQYSVSQVGGDTVINMDGGGQMVLVGVQMATLQPGWIFGT